ncbi:TPA: hypothetical protein DCX15_03025 [bacterium]|nr:hypothetical protein [bacterium]
MLMIIDFLNKGGPILWVIMGLSLVIFTLIIERVLFLRKAKTKNDSLSEFFSLIEERRLKEAEEMAKNGGGVTFKSLLQVLQSRGLPKERQKEELEILIMKETPSLSRFLNFIAVAITAAPILGLLGTVTGMIKVFDALSRLGNPDAHLLAKGISEALITTQAGLIVAIPSLFLHNFLVGRSEALIEEMRHNGLRFITYFDEDKKT